MQSQIPELQVNLKPGDPVSAIPRKSLQYVFDVLKNLKVAGGRLRVNQERWTIEVGQAVGLGVWSGYYWFGGNVYGPVEGINGNYFGINLRTGELAGTGGFADQISDTEEVEWRYVADKVTINEGTDEEEEIYVLSNRTCGDIVFRIT